MENVNTDFATFVRTVVILLALATILVGTGQWQPLGSVSGRSYLFLILSGLATGGSWLCYFRALKLGEAARVAPIDKLSVALVMAPAAEVAAAKQRAVRSGSGKPAPVANAELAAMIDCRQWRPIWFVSRSPSSRHPRFLPRLRQNRRPEQFRSFSCTAMTR